MSGEAMTLFLEDIDVPENRRPVDPEMVSRLAASIKSIGLQHPITVRSVKATSRFQLIAGRHRLEACRAAKMDRLSCRIVKMDDDEARMWEISENLHRAEITALERSEQVSEYAVLARKRRADEKVSQVATPKGGHQPAEKGIRATSEELGISKEAVSRAAKIAGITPKAKVIAVDSGFDDNQSKLLLIAKASTPEKQTEIARRFAATPKPPKIAADPLTDELAAEKQVARLMDAWNAAGPDARAEFMLRIDQPIMDGRYGSAA